MHKAQPVQHHNCKSIQPCRTIATIIATSSGRSHAEGILAWLQHVEFVPVEDTVLCQHLLEGEGGCPGSIIQALPAGGGQVQDMGVCQAPLAAVTAAVQP